MGPAGSVEGLFKSVRVEKLSRDDLPHANAIVPSYDSLIVGLHFVFTLHCCG